jgi:hypothetical protein
MEELENIMAELDVIKQMADLLKSLDDDGRRRALWYLADVAGLTNRVPGLSRPPMTPAPASPVGTAGKATP